MNPTLDGCLTLAMSEVLVSKDPAHAETSVEVLSCLIRHGAGPTPRQISLIGSRAGFVSARKCFLDAICSAVNPLLVGMRLSLLLEDAGGIGNEGQRQVYSRCMYHTLSICVSPYVRFRAHFVLGLVACTNLFVCFQPSERQSYIGFLCDMRPRGAKPRLTLFGLCLCLSSVRLSLP